MSEAIKALRLRWIDTVHSMYDAVDKDIKAKHKLDELVLVHIEMEEHFTNLLNTIEEELIRTTHTIKYINEATAKLKEEIQNG
tara:strand:+ start:3082 stop:3330 length:249 start_codon:yes stop_codon:yes gene_type:complete